MTLTEKNFSLFFSLLNNDFSWEHNAQRENWNNWMFLGKVKGKCFRKVRWGEGRKMFEESKMSWGGEEGRTWAPARSSCTELSWRPNWGGTPAPLYYFYNWDNPISHITPKLSVTSHLCTSTSSSRCHCTSSVFRLPWNWAFLNTYPALSFPDVRTEAPHIPSTQGDIRRLGNL